MERKPLPCIACGHQPESIAPDGYACHTPYGATMFSAGAGHYGSTVWDIMNPNRSLVVNVCDECLLRHRDRTAVKVYTRVLPDIEFVEWIPDVDGD